MRGSKREREKWREGETGREGGGRERERKGKEKREGGREEGRESERN